VVHVRLDYLHHVSVHLQQWVDKLETTYQAAFLNSTAIPFVSDDKKEAGYVRSAGHGAGNIAFMAIYEAGHMVSLRVTRIPPFKLS
jgi:carboxypeptidase C (cathepsin A)